MDETHPAARLGGVALAAAMLAHVAVWTAFGTLTHGSIHHDMAEAWAWGKEWQLGYYKHPPGFAWMAGAYFAAAPRTDLAFFLLSSLNSAVGLAGVWALAGRLLAPSERAASVLLVCLTPFVSLLALKFNANSALLATWPWTVYLLWRALETSSIRHSVLLGIVGALALLTKYYSALLLVSCVTATLLDPRRRAYWSSPAPYVTAAVFLAVLAPHVHWLVTTDGGPLHYAAQRLDHELGAVAPRGLAATAQAVLFHLPAAAMLVAALRPGERSTLASVPGAAMAADGRALAVLALGPFVLTMLAVAAGNARISVQFMVPAFLVLPVAVLALSRARVGKSGVLLLARTAACVYALCLVAAPLLAVAEFRLDSETQVHLRKEVAAEATRIWRESFGVPLAIVGGDQRYSQAVTFYSPDAPSDFIGLDTAQAPWIRRARIDRHGILVICRGSDEACIERAYVRLGTPQRIDLRDFSVRGWRGAGKAQAIAFMVYPPARSPSRHEP